MDFKKYKIIFSPIIIKKYKKIYEYISEELQEEKIALKLMKKIMAKINGLEYMPNIYPKTKISKYDSIEYRKMIIKPFIIIYTIEEQNVYIHNIFHEKNNYYKFY